MEVSAAHNDFAEATLLLLGHCSSRRIPHYIHEGQTKAFVVVALLYIQEEIYSLKPKKAWSRALRTITIHLPVC